MLKHSIIWARWYDPVAPLLSNGAVPAPYEPEEDEHSVAMHRGRESFGVSHVREYEHPGEKGVFRGPILMGPMGIIPLRESNLPSSLFNFWMADTDFVVSKRIKRILQKVPGVETLDVFTPYRFRLGIGRAFEQNAVKASVEKAVQP